ncbi:hypothetical protein KGM_208638 [Danaus plexippus plexippus]|uniref:Uncharacterized protein n=1 Tax=Danaus plexippus plexippus TaxID=278856 RepID=A0A212EQU4_DANPL|nr:hypothetical protein KGM_208638 [Danaus plexippus plexippus]
MEFTPALSTLQGVFISADSVHSFSKLAAKGGNEKKIEYIIECIRKFLVKENYIVGNIINEEHVQILRKFAFYIVLNSDLCILEEMVDLDGIDFVIWTIPTIKRCLMCEILWKLNMENFIYEIIVYSSPYLGLEVAAAFIENFKYFEPTECLSKLKILTAACYRLLARQAFFNIQDNEIKEAFNYFQKCIQLWVNLPNSDKLSRLSRDAEYKFIGDRLHSILLLALDIFSYFTTEQKRKSADFQDIYELTFKEEILKDKGDVVKLSSCNHSILITYLDKSHIDFLDVCQTLVMDVSVDIFCAWTEYEEDDKSMQQKIGELCYKVTETLSKINSISEHPVLSMLQQISTKPVNLEDIINKTDVNIIIENINKADDSSQWIKALLYRDNLCEEQLLIEQLSNHLEELNEEECYKLFKLFNKFIQDRKDTNEFLKGAYSLNELVQYRAPTLAMLAQVLDSVRWKINTFTSIAPPTLDLVIQLQTSLLNTYESDIPENESVWLKSKLRNIKPLNMYYFRLLWNPPGNTFVEVISGIHIHKDMDLEHLVVWLSQIISSTILQEWYQIWDSLLVFGYKNILDIFHKALILICTAEKLNHTDKSRACLLYCIKNYVAVIRYRFFTLPLKDSDISFVVNKFAIIDNYLEEDYVEEVKNVMLPLFSYIAEKNETIDKDIFQRLHNKFKHAIVIDMINNLFNKKMVAE